MEESPKKILFKINSALEYRKILCHICNKYLSVSPIVYNNILGNVCGRCIGGEEVMAVKRSKNKNSDMKEQMVFECVAKYLIFPCSYQENGCDAELEWGEVDDHERYCTFKTVACLLNDRKFLEDDQKPCNWTGDTTEVVSHFTKEHNIYFTNSLRLTLGLEASSIFGTLFGTDSIIYEPKFKSKLVVTEISGEIFILLLYYHKTMNRYFCKVLTDLPYYKCKSLGYQLEIFDDHKKNSIMLANSEIQSLKNYFHLRILDQDALEIDLNYINKLLKMPHFVTVYLKIIEKNEDGSMKLNPSKFGQTPRQIFDEYSMMMKCKLCESYLLQPIFFCNEGHNCCEKCRFRFHACEFCGAEWSVERNYALERLTYVLNYPCKNRLSGCVYIAPMPHILKHEEKCNHSSVAYRSCYFKTCSWKGKHYKAHIEKIHAVLETDTYFRIVHDHKFFIFFNDDIFALDMQLNVDEFFKFHLVCCCTEQLKYRYDLLIEDSRIDTNLITKLSLSQICQPENAVYDSTSVNITIPFNVFPQIFVNWSHLVFKINLFSIQD